MSKQFQRGLIVGKFCPLHRGHEHAIRTMLDACIESFILSYTNPEFPDCEPDKRRRWLTTLFPSARVLVLNADEVPANDADDYTQRQFVGKICRQRFHTTVDAVFTSEDYGAGFAQELSLLFGHPVQHISVDPQRLTHPISGTTLRADIHAHRHMLPAVVYADFVSRICLLGGESSGKSTLAAALAAHFRTNYVTEYGRELWEEQDGHLNYDDMLKIAEVQVAREEAAAAESNRFLFCDTSPLTTLFYSKSMFGRTDEKLTQLARRDYALHVLCSPDFPFVQDGTRRDEAFRQHQHAWYRTELAARGWPWIEVSGSLPERVKAVSQALR